MRTVLVLLALAKAASAGPIEKRCYEGTETSGGKSQRLVAMRELDRDASEVRQHEWLAANPRNEHVQIYKVAADGASFTFRRGSIDGKGTLTGPAWKWTSYHEIVELPAGNGTATADGKLAGSSLKISARIEHAGKTMMSLDIDAKSFDCAELDKRRAGLDDTAADAKHVCFAGKQTNGSTLAIEQVFEPKRIQVLTAGEKRDTRVVLAIDGKAITVTRGSSTIGTGELIGTPGAWTGYKYSKNYGQFTLTTEGTLGGAHFHQTTSTHGARDLTNAIDGDAVDCKLRPAAK